MPEKKPKKAESFITIVGPAGGSRSRSSRDLIEKAVDPETVRIGYAKFLIALQDVVDVPPPKKSNFVLEEVEFSAEISANGEFKLLGTGIGLEATGGVTFKLRRQPTLD